ncbi:MAG: glycosyltransferase family 2 protein [Trueperella sp.]|nr:glycosyltransferase family 2 protein [Trueperella sp.]
MKLRVVTVAYNSGDELLTFATSLTRAAIAFDYELVVVNNGDSRCSFAALQEQGARIIEPGKNLGYGQAANLGARDFVGDWLLVVNPDVELQPDTLANLLAAAERWPQAGALGPMLLTPAGEIYPSARSFPRLVTGIGHAILAEAFPNNPFTSSYRKNSDPHTEYPVDWLSGACLLLRHQAFVEVGGFDPEFFMFFEDTQLGEALAGAGWQSVFVPSARVVHDQGKSWRDQPAAMIAAHHHSAYQYLRRIYSAPWQAPLRGILWLGLQLRSRLMQRFANR